MTKLSMTLAIASLTVSLAPSVQAYGQGPEATQQASFTTKQLNILFKAAERANDGQCSVGIDPTLVAVLGLDKPLQSTVQTGQAMACHAE